MEIDYNKDTIGTPSKSEVDKSIIKVSAIITCPSCNFKKKFINQFHQQDLENMVVAIKCLDWLTCNKCGELLNLNLEFEI